MGPCYVHVGLCVGTFGVMLCPYLLDGEITFITDECKASNVLLVRECRDITPHYGCTRSKKNDQICTSPCIPEI